MDTQRPDDVGPAPTSNLPRFVHRDEVIAGFADLFAWFQAPDITVENLIKCAVLSQDTVILLSGAPGTGKNQLVALVRRLFFRTDDSEGSDDGTDSPDEHRYDAWRTTCSQDITPHDVLYYLDLGRLQQGEEVVAARPLIGARLKYINEIQRATPMVHNALLSLLSEHDVTYRNQIFRSPRFICFMDRNPADAGSIRIPMAFLDRIDCSIEIPGIRLGGAMALQKRKLSSGTAMWNELAARVPVRLTSAQMAEIWEDVLRVDLPERVLALANMVYFAFRVCIVTDRTVAHPDFRLDCSHCEFKAEICSHVETPPPYRLVESGLRIAQARAWLNGNASVDPEDFYFALPFIAGHRVQLRPELRGRYGHAQQWIMDDAWDTIRKKLPSWKSALDARRAGDRESRRALHDMARKDLVVAELETAKDW